MSVVELLVLSLLLAIPMWVYYDATKNNIGQIGKRSFLNFNAGGWAACVFIVPPAGFLMYLYKRPKLIEAAKEHPVCYTFLNRLVVMLVILGCTIGMHLLMTLEPPVVALDTTLNESN